MEVSVVIVSYNVKYFISLCISSVQKALENISGEIVVVDNASQDGSVEHIKNHFPDVRLIASQDNLGFSKANNLGVAQSKGKYVLILNPDTVIGENTLNQLLNYYDKFKNPGALGVQLINGTGLFLPESKRGIPRLSASFYRMMGKTSKKGTYYANHIAKSQTDAVDILVGAFMFLDKDLYLRVGGFDEVYFMYGEDIDLSYELLKDKRQNYYIGEIKAIHFKGESTRKDVRYLNYFYGAMEIFYKKHFKHPVLLRWLVKMGIKCWFLFKYIKLTDAPITLNDPTNVLYVGNHNIKIDPNMKQKLQFIRSKSFKQLEQFIVKNKIEEVWFQVGFLTYEQIIEIMAQLQPHNLQFKFHDEGVSYVLGSNSSDGRGEVIDLLPTFSPS